MEWPNPYYLPPSPLEFSKHNYLNSVGGFYAKILFGSKDIEFILNNIEFCNRSEQDKKCIEFQYHYHIGSEGNFKAWLWNFKKVLSTKSKHRTLTSYQNPWKISFFLA